MDKSTRINDLYQRYLAEYQNEETVLGDGDIECPLMMIGEAPGKEEVVQNKPFVGLAGGNLKQFIDYIGKTRNDFYVTNAIKYRLFKVNPVTNRKSNRPAKVEEIKQNRDYLLEEIKIINPSIIITLGNVPLKCILGRYDISIGDYHGKPVRNDQAILFPLYHPASLIYNRALEKTYYDDLDQLKSLVKGEE
ncbi:MAG: uracil-DNA glycosylase [Clostridia bacterium]|nr:uracil-DNA glycosylase [Clostridia bacterium]